MAKKSTRTGKTKKTKKGVFFNTLARNKTYTRFVFIAVFAVVGTLLLGIINAQSARDAALVDVPERGLNYKGIEIAKSGPCKGQIEHKHTPGDKTGDPSPPAVEPDVFCTHLDPGPVGVDLRERIKTIDQRLAAQVEHDRKNPPKASDDPSTEPQPETPNDVLGQDSLSAVTARNWPCIGTGKDGSRVQWIYVYAAGSSNNVNTHRAALESIARRVNNVFYLSGVDAGRATQIRFATESNCSLSIASEAISGNLYDFNNVSNQLIFRGYINTNRKYMVSVDSISYIVTGSPCGEGAMYVDDRASTSLNANNNGNQFSIVWKVCWNYAEPHELLHNLGGVQASAPNATNFNHCLDQHDVMCYDDGGIPAKKSLSTVCTSTSSLWRLDCRKNDYFDTWQASGYLSTHWNTANNRFLTQ